ncbi:transporter substrate-binding domain-containing protein [Chitinivorax sp. PXF-14]|uniref:substrate-binding periplasmic protein n=1 Tax=Chitinivorax sp. PXF-14 TaxID=3230488 RepID=UPI0034672BB1
MSAGGVSIRRRALLRGLLACGMAPLLAHAGGDVGVIYPRPESPRDHRFDYYWQLLQRALELTAKTPDEARLTPSTLPMNQARAAQMLAEGEIDVLVRSTSIELERRFLPIRIPLDKGLLGYRVFLLRRSLLPQLATVRSFEELRRFSIGQGTGWNDVPALRAAGLQVVEGADYEGLFKMLLAGRFDLFSRSVVEVQDEYTMRHEAMPELAIDSSLLLYYPLARYCFVARSDAGAALARRIETGLRRMQADGSFDRLFNAYARPIVGELGLRSRRLFRIANPVLPPETPLSDKSLWYDPF